MERRVTKAAILNDPKLSPAQKATFTHALNQGASLWHSDTEGFIIKNRSGTPLPQPAVVEIRKSASDKAVPKHFRPKRRRR